jgi:hypothetical protein
LVEVEGATPLHLLDPFDPKPGEVEAWRREVSLEAED